MVVEDSQNIQERIEKDLFDEHNKILDRFYSLIGLIFTASGFTLTVITFSISRGVTTLSEAINNYHISLCLLSLFLAFLISILNVLALSHHRRLIKRGNSIGYRDGDKLANNNVKLYSAVAKQKDYYIIAISLIAFSLISLYNYFAKHHFLTIMLTIGFFVMVASSIAESRRYRA